MKLLLFSDLHCDTSAAQRLVEKSAEADVLIGAGDFATCRRDIQATLHVLQAVTKPAVLVPGNAESVQELQQAAAQWASARVLHGSGTQIDGVAFFGLGGAVPVTPFGDWSYDLSEEQAAELLANCPPHAVLVTHSPPKGYVDTSEQGKHLGSTAVLQAIERTSPTVVVCGHVHACWEQTQTAGETTIINAGPRGVLWEL